MKWGSYLLWDSLKFTAPPEVKLAAVPDFIAVNDDDRLRAVVWHGGQPSQPIVARVFHVGPPVTATLNVGGRKRAIVLRSGVQTVEEFLPPVETKELVPMSISNGDRVLAETKVQRSPLRKWEVYILMHSHNDNGFTDIQPNIAKRQAQNVIRAMELIRKTKDYPEGARFKWNLEVLLPYEDFRQVATPEQMREFERDAAEGTIGIDAMYGNLLTEQCRAEELLRQFSFATALDGAAERRSIR